MTDRAIVAGDVHLGADNADVEAFDAFLADLLRRREEFDELVLVGDVWDLIRRDPFGCAWETSENITRLRRLGERLPVRIVLGNHDAYLDVLDDARYEVEFLEEYVLDQGETSVRVRHGNGFDRFQSDALSAYLSGPGDRGDIDPTRGRKDPIVATARELVQVGVGLLTSGSSQASKTRRYGRRERRAHAYLETIPEDKLIYGHTHAPYVHHANLAANPGSWKSTAPVSNTYLEVVEGDISLYRYRPDGDDQLLEP